MDLQGEGALARTHGAETEPERRHAQSTAAAPLRRAVLAGQPVEPTTYPPTTAPVRCREAYSASFVAAPSDGSASPASTGRITKPAARSTQVGTTAGRPTMNEPSGCSSMDTVTII